MKPEYLIIRGSIFTDLTPGTRHITLVGAYENNYEAETALGNLVENAITPDTYYIVQFKQSLDVFMKPAVKINYFPADVSEDNPT